MEEITNTQPTQDQADVTPQVMDSFEQVTDNLLNKAASDSETQTSEQPEQDVKSEVSQDSVKQTPEQAKTTQAVQTEEFEIGQNLKLRSGNKLTPELFNEIKSGYLRQADYTRKTQEVKAIREEAMGVLAARERIANNPQELRQFLDDVHILNAFHPHELLNNALEANGVDAEAWNQFLTNYEEGGFEVKKDWRADPYAKKFDEFGKELKPLKEFVSNYNRDREAFTKRQVEEKAKVELDAEIGSAMKKFSGVTRKEILVEIVADQTGRTVEQIAQQLKVEKDKTLSEYQKTLSETKQKTKSGQAKGISIPLMKKAPQSFDEATDAALESYAAGQLGQR